MNSLAAAAGVQLWSRGQLDVGEVPALATHDVTAIVAGTPLAGELLSAAAEPVEAS